MYNIHTDFCYPLIVLMYGSYLFFDLRIVLIVIVSLLHSI